MFPRVSREVVNDNEEESTPKILDGKRSSKVHICNEIFWIRPQKSGGPDTKAYKIQGNKLIIKK